MRSSTRYHGELLASFRETLTCMGREVRIDQETVWSDVPSCERHGYLHPQDSTWQRGRRSLGDGQLHARLTGVIMKNLERAEILQRGIASPLFIGFRTEVGAGFGDGAEAQLARGVVVKACVHLVRIVSAFIMMPKPGLTEI